MAQDSKGLPLQSTLPRAQLGLPACPSHTEGSSLPELRSAAASQGRTPAPLQISPPLSPAVSQVETGFRPGFCFTSMKMLLTWANSREESPKNSSSQDQRRKTLKKQTHTHLGYCRDPFPTKRIFPTVGISSLQRGSPSQGSGSPFTPVGNFQGSGPDWSAPEFQHEARDVLNSHIFIEEVWGPHIPNDDLCLTPLRA